MPFKKNSKISCIFVKNEITKKCFIVCKISPFTLFLTHPVNTYKTLRAHFLFQLWTFSLFKDIMGQWTSTTMSCSVALDHQHSWRSPLDLAAGLCHLPCVQQVHGLAPGVLIEPRHEGALASQQPRPSIKEHPRDLVFKACSLFRGQIEALIEAEDDYINCET